jgi:hypothetical protein
MEKGEEKFFTVGELARRCGVTVRTLQYYDKEGLLSPRHYTEGGRRLYAWEDIVLLQQILFLKYFGFSLEEIRDRPAIGLIAAVIALWRFKKISAAA